MGERELQRRFVLDSICDLGAAFDELPDHFLGDAIAGDMSDVVVDVLRRNLADRFDDRSAVLDPDSPAGDGGRSAGTSAFSRTSVSVPATAPASVAVSPEPPEPTTVSTE
ncbi:hypothetical protein [Halosolutus halophilus]|uniref:hypothetical protein n=1 Tax=Halosolutus halophilus TaxID=1552990 RepID=UPI002234F7A8|nr:hypothetical protein [Halosolutus halophilus]